MVVVDPISLSPSTSRLAESERILLNKAFSAEGSRDAEGSLREATLSISGKLSRTASRSTVHSLENDEIGLFARYETSGQADLLPLTQRK